MNLCSSATVSHLFIYFYVNVFLCVGMGVGRVTRGDLRCSPNVLIVQKIKLSLEEAKGPSQNHIASWGRVGTGNLVSTWKQRMGPNPAHGRDL